MKAFDVPGLALIGIVAGDKLVYAKARAGRRSTQPSA